MELGDIISIISAMFMLIMILFLAYFVIRWLGKRTFSGNSRLIKILDKVMLSQDKSLVVVQVGSKTMLVCITANVVQKLCDIEDIDALLLETPEINDDFSKVLKNTIDSVIKRGGKSEKKS